MSDYNHDETKGKFKEVGGTVEKNLGEMTDNEDMAARGAKHETEGKAQGLWGKTKNAVGDAVDTVKDAVDPNNKDPMVDDTTRTDNRY